MGPPAETLSSVRQACSRSASWAMGEPRRASTSPKCSWGNALSPSPVAYCARIDATASVPCSSSARLLSREKLPLTVSSSPPSESSCSISSLAIARASSTSVWPMGGPGSGCRAAANGCCQATHAQAAEPSVPLFVPLGGQAKERSIARLDCEGESGPLRRRASCELSRSGCARLATAHTDCPFFSCFTDTTSRVAMACLARFFDVGACADFGTRSRCQGVGAPNAPIATPGGNALRSTEYCRCLLRRSAVSIRP